MFNKSKLVSPTVTSVGLAPDGSMDETDRWEDGQAWLKSRAPHPDREAEPVRVVIDCPECSAPHVDEGEWATTRHHKTHQCQSCDHEWRPFPYATVGVSREAEPTEGADGPALAAFSAFHGDEVIFREWPPSMTPAAINQWRHVARRALSVSPPAIKQALGYSVEPLPEGVGEAVRKVDLWIKCGMPDQSDNTPTRDALKRDLRTIISALSGKPPS